MLDEAIWHYISSRVDNDNVLPCEDDIYTAFQKHFEIGGHKVDEIEKVVQSYVSCSELTGVIIEWEGKLDGIRIRRTLSELEVSQQTA